jgi:hypothetical protein
MPSECQRLEERRDNEQLEVGGISRWHSKHGSAMGHGLVFFLTIGRPALSLGTKSAVTEVVGFCSHIRLRAKAGLGRLGIVQ